MEALGKHFNFQRVQLFRTESLGIGSYGAVYRAKCDQLPCAGKLLHPILFQDGDPGSQRIQQRFVQECHFLSGIRHPHIVQYLGMCVDGESSLPVLLMELMDESLTHLLERHQESLPFHQEVNICHDVALALAYLHSNDIIHRDLSSNNVLLDAGRRAKVTDFGMSKLLDIAPSPFTHCPGTAVYMPPEGLRNPPMYTTKLDCFSFGVLSVQVMSRQFPNPGPEEQVVEDARSPVGTIKIPIPETDRRKCHIDLIDPIHPLLPLALQCLSYADGNRPSAQELCDRLELLRESPQYNQSVALGQEQQLQRQIQELHQQLQEKDAAITTASEQQRHLREQLDESIHRHQETEQNYHTLQQSYYTLDQHHRELVQEKEHLIEGREQQLRDLHHQLQTSEAMVAEYQHTLHLREREIRELRQTISGQEMRELHEKRGPVQVQESCAVPAVKLTWTTCPSAPTGLARGSVTVNGSKAYFLYWNDVYEYDGEKRRWSQLSQCPNLLPTLVMVNGQLTAVGGQHSNWAPTNTLLNLTQEGGESKWCQRYPSMPTKRWRPAAICNGGTLVVAGGRADDDDDTLVAVEVMNTSSLQWYVAPNLPHFYNIASATVCGNTLYLMGGVKRNGFEGSQSVLTCSLRALHDSLSLATKRTHRLWRRAADVPVYFTTCINFCGQLLAVGGNRKSSYRESDPTDNVYMYDSSVNTWKIVSHIPMPRYRCLVAVLPEEKLLVVGGRTTSGYGLSDVTELGQLSQ